jgi:hydrogenase 3 maturation protease
MSATVAPGAGLLEALAARLTGDVVVVGIGNPSRGDDAAGCLVTRRLPPVPGLRAVVAEEVPESHLGAIVAGPPSTIVLVDAVDLGAPAGSVGLLDTRDLVRFTPTTHRVPLGVLAAWLAAETGADVFVLAVQPLQTRLGARVSPEVDEGTARLAAALGRAMEARPC